jgi:hypothetical protein
LAVVAEAGFSVPSSGWGVFAGLYSVDTVERLDGYTLRPEHKLQAIRTASSHGGRIIETGSSTVDDHQNINYYCQKAG